MKKKIVIKKNKRPQEIKNEPSIVKIEDAPKITTPINNMDKKEVQKKIEKLHMECPKYEHCTKREFLIGLGFGIIIGIIAIKVLQMIMQ